IGAFGMVFWLLMMPPSQKVTATFEGYDGDMPLIILTNSGKCDVFVSVGGDWTLMRHIPVKFPPSGGLLLLRGNTIFLTKGSSARAWLRHITQSISPTLQHSTTLQLQCVAEISGLRYRLNR